MEYKYDRSNDRFVIGPHIVDVRDPEAALHEVCHFTQLETDRLLLRPEVSWGLVPGTEWYIAGKSGFEMHSDADVQREAQVWAYQHAVARELGWKPKVMESARLGTYFGGWCYYLKRHGIDFRQERLGFRKLAEQIEELSTTTHTFESFKRELKSRTEAFKASRQENHGN